MPVTLDQIVAATRRRVGRIKDYTDMRALTRQAERHQPRGFQRALREVAQQRFGIIAELKKASPSRGLIRASFHPAALASELEFAGATVLSVLTDEEFFQGSLDYLAETSAAVKIPLLRKDFIIDEFQIIEARANCADAILLIVAALSDAELSTLYAKAKEFGLDVLCEVHDEAELSRALNAGFEIIGVNSRDLRTFHVDLNTAIQLGSRIPASVLRVAESGIASGDDIAHLRMAGYEAFLIGESLMKMDRPGDALRDLISAAEQAQKAAAQ
ncbi:MAG: indole-3-glycerol phosphate synthase TrpC [Terriglobales bacterium]